MSPVVAIVWIPRSNDKARFSTLLELVRRQLVLLSIRYDTGEDDNGDDADVVVVVVVMLVTTFSRISLHAVCERFHSCAPNRSGSCPHDDADVRTCV